LGSSGRTLDVAVLWTLTVTSVLGTGSGETSELSMLHHGGGDPVDSRITTDGLVLWVDQDHLEVLVRGILGDPVGVKHTERTALSSDTFFGLGPEGTAKLKLSDTGNTWFTVGDTLGDRSLTASTLDTDSVDHVALLGLVTETSGFVWTSWSGRPVDGRELTKLPGSDTKQEPEDVRLLTLVKLFEVFVCTHVVTCERRGERERG
jgi:hypothetical protein